MSVTTDLDKITDKMKKCGSDGFLAAVMSGDGCAMVCHEMSSKQLLGVLIIITEFYKESHRDAYDLFISMQEENAEKMTRAFKRNRVDEEKENDEEVEFLDTLEKAMADVMKRLKEKHR